MTINHRILNLVRKCCIECMQIIINYKQKVKVMKLNTLMIAC